MTGQKYCFLEENWLFRMCVHVLCVWHIRVVCRHVHVSAHTHTHGGADVKGRHLPFAYFLEAWSLTDPAAQQFS